uniref:Uncharacterized protein n=1 Tax=Rhizophora mucronata TaxID=61149 RepID=A0A2P2K8N1_RHIMU
MEDCLKCRKIRAPTIDFFLHVSFESPYNRKIRIQFQVAKNMSKKKSKHIKLPTKKRISN